MINRNKIVIVVITIFFIVIVVAGVSWALRPKGPSTLLIRVTCSGSWTGNLGDLRGTQSVDGTGNKAYSINREGQQIWIVTAVFQKSDWGGHELKVTIETTDGKVLRSGSTTAEFGLVTVTWSSEG